MNRGLVVILSAAALISVAVAPVFADGGTSVGTVVGTSVGTKIGTSLGTGANAAPGTVQPGCANSTAARSAPLTGPGSAPDPNLIPTIPYGIGGQSNLTASTFGYGASSGCAPRVGSTPGVGTSPAVGPFAPNQNLLGF
jgi:hypothetical protein